MDQARNGVFHPPRSPVMPVGERAVRLHLLLAADGAERDGVPLASVILRHGDGGQTTLRLAYGLHVRSLVPAKGEDRAGRTAGPIPAWQAAARGPGRSVTTNRIYVASFDVEPGGSPIQSIQLVSLFGRPTLGVLGLTLEREQEERVAEARTRSRLERRARELEDDQYHRDLRIRVTVPTGDLVTNATAALTISDAESTFSFGQGRRAPDGSLLLSYPPQQAGTLTVVVKSPGRRPFVRSIECAAGETVPAEITAVVETGRRVGGLVQDAGGRPLAGATVVVQHLRQERPKEYARLDYDPVLTDAAGRWSTGGVPDSLTEFQFQVSHPEYRPALAVASTGKVARGISVWKADDVLAARAVISLEPALRLAGRVIDGDGKAVPGVSVRVQGARAPDVEGADLSTATDGSGKFVFHLQDEGPYAVIVVSSNHPARMQTVSLPEGTNSPMDLVLGAPRAMKGMVTDQRQQPIAGARLRLEAWNDTRSLQFETESGPDGRFVWENPPDGALLVLVSATNHSSTTYSISGETAEQRFTLSKLSRVFGQVVDAETRKPIEEFAVVRGRAYNEGEPIRWERYNLIRGRRGEYSVRLNEGMRTAVLIEAPGYMPVASGVFTNAGVYTNHFELKKARGIEGLVVDETGTPVSGATLVLVDPAETAYLDRSGGLRRNEGGDVVRSDRGGRFEFPPKLEPHTILASHARGYAEMRVTNFLALGRIQLQPWARVEGVNKVPSSGDRTVEVRVQNTFYRYDDDTRESAPLSLYLTAEPASDGSFVFPRVPPGERRVTLQHVIRVRNSSRSQNSHGVAVVLKPGETKVVQIGGTGRTVTGRVNVVGGDPSDVDWTRDFHVLNLVQPLEMNIPPMDFSKAKTPAEQQALWAEQRRIQNQFWRTPKGRDHERAQASYVLEFQTNGTFRVESIPPGNYQLTLSVTDSSREDYSYETIGSLTKPVTIPADGKPGEPFDLGAFDLQVRGTLRVGKRAPRFEVSDSAGKKLRLEDLQGKFVVLYFWAAWAGLPKTDLQVLTDLHNAYSKNERLAVLGLNFDPTAEMAEQNFKSNPAPWRQYHAGAWGQSAIQTSYGLRGVPSGVLIGPDGKIAALNLRGAGLRRAVERAVGAAPAAPTSGPVIQP